MIDMWRDLKIVIIIIINKCLNKELNIKRGELRSHITYDNNNWKWMALAHWDEHGTKRAATKMRKRITKIQLDGIEKKASEWERRRRKKINFPKSNIFNILNPFAIHVC